MLETSGAYHGHHHHKQVPNESPITFYNSRPNRGDSSESTYTLGKATTMLQWLVSRQILLLLLNY